MFSNYIPETPIVENSLSQKPSLPFPATATNNLAHPKLGDSFAMPLNNDWRSWTPDKYGCDTIPLLKQSFPGDSFGKTRLRYPSGPNEVKKGKEVGGLETMLWAEWNTDAGDIMIASRVVVTPDTLLKPQSRIFYRTPGWGDYRASIELSGDGVDLTGIRSSNFVNFACRPINCNCDPSNPSPSCLCRVAYLDLEFGAGHTWKNGAETKIKRENCYDKREGVKISATHKQPMGENVHFEFNAEKTTSSGWKSPAAWGAKILFRLMG